MRIPDLDGTGIEADTKLIVSWMVGDRDALSANIFMDDLQSRLANRVQLTTDGLRVYLDAVAGAFEGRVDYAQLVKIYGPSLKARGATAPPNALARSSPA